MALGRRFAVIWIDRGASVCLFVRFCSFMARFGEAWGRCLVLVLGWGVSGVYRGWFVLDYQLCFCGGASCAVNMKVRVINDDYIYRPPP